MPEHPAPSTEPILTGRLVPPQPWRTVRAGELVLRLDGPDVRRVDYRGIEVAQQLFMAVRDVSWNTLPGIVEASDLSEGPGPGFEAFVRTRHRSAALGVDLTCEHRIAGSTEGELSYHLDVTAHEAIEYSRIGLNVLHGVRTYAGRPFRSWAGDVETTGRLPELIGPQALVGGRLSGLSAPFERLELSPRDGVYVELRFEGDEFETEDQRNFGDATFKTYSTPLQRPAPFRLEPGEHLRQSCTIRVRDERIEVSTPTPGDVVSIRLGAPSGKVVPGFGLGQADDEAPLSTAELERVRALRPEHLRVELDLERGAVACVARLAATVEETRRLGCDLWVDLLAGPDDGEVLEELVRAVSRVDPVPRVLHLATRLHEPPDQGRSARLLAAVRAILAEEGVEVDVGVGPQMNLSDLNRAPFDGEVVGRLTFPSCPTVHRVDDATVLENVDRLRDTVPSLRRSLGQLPLTAGPVTLSSVHGPYPAGPGGELPARVDVRQVSLLAAAVTMGQLTELSHGGVDALTFHETAGPLGVAERDAGSAWPERFLSRRGTVYPLWHVLADAADLRGAEILDVEVQPAPVFTPTITTLAATGADGTDVLVASLVREPQSILLAGLRVSRAAMRILDATSAERAGTDPLGYRSGWSTSPVAGGRLNFELPAFAVARVRLATGS